MKRRERNLLAYLTKRLGAPRGSGPEYQFDCPACIDRIGSESVSPKLGVNLAKGMGGCFRCEYGFRSFHALFRYINGGTLRIEEIALLRDFRRIQPGERLSKEVERLLNPVVQGVKLKPRPLPPYHRVIADDPKHPSVQPGIKYLRERGVAEELWEEHQIGYCWTGPYQKRLIFPVIQFDEVVYWTNRYCGDHPLKSKNPPNTEGFYRRAECLLGYDRCRGVERIALVEGPFDMMAFEHALGAMGKHLSHQHLRLIDQLVEEGLVEVVIASDDDAGQAAAGHFAALYGRVPECSVLSLNEGDPWSRRADLEALLPSRGEPSFSSRLPASFQGRSALGNR